MFSTEDLITDATEEQDWAIYKTASDVGMEPYNDVGELSDYPNSGYFLTFDSLETSKESYLD